MIGWVHHTEQEIPLFPATSVVFLGGGSLSLLPASVSIRHVLHPI